MKIGFIGAGNMGLPMARRLVRAGHELTVYNRTRKHAEPLTEDGARIADTPADAAGSAEVLISMLADDPAVRSAVLDPDAQSAIGALPAGAIHMSSSTISVGFSKELAARHAEHGQGYIAVPVLGRPDAAAAGKLWLMAAGAKEHLDRCRPLMDAIGRGVTVFGDEPWKANLVKIGVNFMLAAMLEATGEAYALVEKAGIDALLFLDVMNGGAFNSPVFQKYGSSIAARYYQPAGFKLALGYKDLTLALEASADAAVPMPIAGILRDRYLQALAQGLSDFDWAAIAELARRNAGVGQP
jgi:3-hydroxyisobutyrate dehydrogenase-like beta-hydroxyacid dehydrogenase